MTDVASRLLHSARGALFGIAAAAMFTAGPAAVASAETTRPVVVELYTSQGCSSCPPADAFMGELIKQKDIIGLTFHVDYWDYIGWKDTFASPETTQRQRAYGQVLGQRYPYTPQMVVGGKLHEVGSNRAGVRKAINYVAMEASPVDVSTKRDGDNVTVHLPETELDGKAWVWLVRFDKRHDVEIRRGENGGRKLSYFNVVRSIERIAVWDGKSTDLAIDIADMQADGRDGCAIIVQSMGYGPVLGAARIDFADDAS